MNNQPTGLEGLDFFDDEEPLVDSIYPCSLRTGHLIRAINIVFGAAAAHAAIQACLALLEADDPVQVEIKRFPNSTPTFIIIDNYPDDAPLSQVIEEVQHAATHYFALFGVTDDLPSDIDGNNLSVNPNTRDLTDADNDGQADRIPESSGQEEIQCPACGYPHDHNLNEIYDDNCCNNCGHRFTEQEKQDRNGGGGGGGSGFAGYETTQGDKAKPFCPDCGAGFDPTKPLAIQAGLTDPNLQLWIWRCTTCGTTILRYIDLNDGTPAAQFGD